jgi:hypothetical protein
VIGDADDDDGNPGSEPRDGDDRSIRDYGRVGSAAERASIADVLRRYYAAASAGWGAAACRLMAPSLANDSRLARLLPSAYRPSARSSVFQGKDCAGVESLLFDINRDQARVESATLRVTEVRILGAHALAVMRFKTIGERQTDLARTDRGWMLDALVDSPLP